MAAARLVVTGGSAGAIEALQVILAGLPQDFPAALCVVVHSAPDLPSMLAHILGSTATMPVVTAATEMPLRDGTVYVAPPDHHLVVQPGTLVLTRGPRENRFRPAIDPLFRSAARIYGPAALGVILTGHLDDGTAGLWTIKRLGGVAIVQDPSEARFPSMPQSAVRHVDVDYSVRLRDIAPLLERLVAAPADQRDDIEVPESVDVEARIAEEVNAVNAGIERIGEPSSFSCPDVTGFSCV